MKVIHGTWIPNSPDQFKQEGCFYLWVETDQAQRRKGNQHPFQLQESALIDLMVQELGVGGSTAIAKNLQVEPRFFLLPSQDETPIHSPEIARYLEQDLPHTFDWQWWQIDCLRLDTYQQSRSLGKNHLAYVFPVLQDLHFLASVNLTDIQIGSDLLFWYHYCQSFKSVINRDQFIPSLTYRDITPAKKKSTPRYEIYPEWEILSDDYETLLERSLSAIPLSCCAGFAEPQDDPVFHEQETLLRHFSEVILNNLITHTDFPAVFQTKISDTLLESCISLRSAPTGVHPESISWFSDWWQWRDRIAQTQASLDFQLSFILESPHQSEDPWDLRFFVAPTNDPSLRLALRDYWQFTAAKSKKIKQSLGKDFEQKLLLTLGYAARIYPALWSGLETDQPEGIILSLEEAATFLQETAWVLEDAGFRVIVPAWWTPQGQRRAKLRLRPHSKKSSAKSESQSYFSLETLVDYQYELTVGDEVLTPQEWEDLVNAKSSLVQFRGEWLQLDPAKMQEMLSFWQAHRDGDLNLSLLDLMKIGADPTGDIEIDASRDRLMGDLLSTLHNKSQLKPIGELPLLKGTLRDYQGRGVAWLSYLESLGLNGCLADDMGLGKTVQVIARLVQERLPADGKKNSQQTAVSFPPTLLIAPTSVLGNWVKELERFAPDLKGMVHHGSDRPNTVKEFQKICQSLDLLITSFTLIRKDIKLFDAVDWHRIVLDEAQNIKNPKAAQTKAILKLNAPHRLALTGTPVENRLLDLWSVFNFLNPGYLGKEAQFRNNFERPIQRNNDQASALQLKKLVEPFILRRVKTDPDIISDLPDKVEQKLFCNLTKEQASLYEAVTKNVLKELEKSEGIQRQGLMLSTLMKLKQVCNHPMQFLQDNSDFSPERSHKLSRLQEMTAEVIEEGESMLIFTQFTEIGEALQQFFRQTHFYNTFYIHGGTSRKKRESMIAEFQDSQTPPSVFILSLKAGGVGITLTKANHVFHFDRWWNPAVEDQATDRAFRIGQQKNVFVHKFVAIGTLEERIDQMIEDKKKLAGAVVGNDESWLTQLDNETFKQLIALNKNAILD